MLRPTLLALALLTGLAWGWSYHTEYELRYLRHGVHWHLELAHGRMTLIITAEQTSADYFAAAASPNLSYGRDPLWPYAQDVFPLHRVQFQLWIPAAAFAFFAEVLHLLELGSRRWLPSFMRAKPRGRS